MERKKHAKPRKGFKTEDSSAYLDQHPILGDKGMIYITPYSNGKWYFRTWISEEGKYLRKSLRTTDKQDAIRLAEQEYLNVYATIQKGHKVFGLKWSELCEEFIQHKQQDVEVGRIKESRLKTIKTQINRWIIPFLTPTKKISELDVESFRDYYYYRKQKTNNQVLDVTLRNEHTTINAISRFGYRKGYIPFPDFNFDPIKIIEPPRRDTFTVEEYQIFYKKMRDWVSDARDKQEEYMRPLIRDFILLKSNSCMRFGEINQLKWKMVKTKRIDGQNLVWIELPADICKNKKSRGFWSRGGQYIDRLKKYAPHPDPESYVFSHPKFDRPLARATYYKYWKNLLEFSGFDKLEKDLTYYSLRHFGITARLLAKVPIYDVAKMAGTNVQFIEQHYEHIEMDKLVRNALKGFKVDENGFVLGE